MSRLVKTMSCSQCAVTIINHWNRSNLWLCVFVLLCNILWNKLQHNWCPHAQHTCRHDVNFMSKIVFTMAFNWMAASDLTQFVDSLKAAFHLPNSSNWAWWTFPIIWNWLNFGCFWSNGVEWMNLQKKVYVLIVNGFFSLTQARHSGCRSINSQFFF